MKIAVKGGAGSLNTCTVEECPIVQFTVDNAYTLENCHVVNGRDDKEKSFTSHSLTFSNQI